jgi:UDP-N-acetylmuramate-alanine ligase
MRRGPAPFEFGSVHFIGIGGIGGIGMSGIDEIMRRQGYAVQGSDARQSANTHRPAAPGARIFIGHQAENVAGASAIVYSRDRHLRSAVLLESGPIPRRGAFRDVELALLRRHGPSPHID